MQNSNPINSLPNQIGKLLLIGVVSFYAGSAVHDRFIEFEAAHIVDSASNSELMDDYIQASFNVQWSLDKQDGKIPKDANQYESFQKWRFETKKIEREANIKRLVIEMKSGKTKQEPITYLPTGIK